MARLIDSLGDDARSQADRWPLWSSVCFGAGCGCYFILKEEPATWPLAAAGLELLGLWLVGRARGLPRAATLSLLMLACFSGGLAVAKLRAEAVAAPIAPADMAPTQIEGWVMDVDSPGQNGARIVVAPVRVRGLTPEATPERLRVTVKGAPPPPGAAIRVFGILNPPPPPASPGAYDFGRNAYFQGMGGTLFALGPTRAADLAPPPWRVRMEMRVNAVRYALAERIVARLGERTGGVAAAMTTGHETWIQSPDLDAMRDSGLAHILSISGLHMAVVGGFVFFTVRLLVAAWPWLALRVSGKKVAAIAGLIAVGTYLVISGAPPPAERAAVTASIAFLAVLADRQAVTMRALAAAAFVVLLLRPEAVVTPGFQMSFAATAALVALVEVWPRRIREFAAPWPIVMVQRFGSWLLAACAASLVAGMATGPFAMQHFNRTAVYGLIANLATAPLADFIMMPALALGAALEPLGLGAPFLWLAGKSVDAMLAIGHWAASLPGAVQAIPSAPAAALPVAFLGILFMCLWRGRWRWVGLPFAAAVLIWPRPAPPDVWIGDGGANAAYRQGEQAVVMRPAVRQFASDLWSRRRGLEAVGRPGEGWTCKRSFCAPEDREGALALWWGKAAPGAEEMDQMCRNAEVISVRAVVAALPPSCEGRLVLDGADHARGGSVELWRDEAGGWRALWTAEVRGRRPWSGGGTD
ncbi:ComEC/Rec2 family competence protein [Brevundimonas diminuta]|uniref:ComEC/Rec2 family competence protein n=1 Tax=Brevundimonas diminuta TaxID=293 RepID=UPI00320A4243